MESEMKKPHFAVSHYNAVDLLSLFPYVQLRVNILPKVSPIVRKRIGYNAAVQQITENINNSKQRKSTANER
ncbi:hypothetical protein [Paenibacillus gansuensis]|uniref:Uncharacterized protein n=1 Tax=Paenibacillus gansuensis TaxID=306542 RepID=A0ABW5PJT0_9BACL